MRNNHKMRGTLSSWLLLGEFFIGGDDSNDWFIWIKYSIMKLKF